MQKLWETLFHTGTGVRLEERPFIFHLSGDYIKTLIYVNKINPSSIDFHGLIKNPGARRIYALKRGTGMFKIIFHFELAIGVETGEVSDIHENRIELLLDMRNVVDKPGTSKTAQNIVHPEDRDYDLTPDGNPQSSMGL